MMSEKGSNSIHTFVEIVLFLYTFVGLLIIGYALKELAIFVLEKMTKNQPKRSISKFCYSRRMMTTLIPEKTYI